MTIWSHPQKEKSVQVSAIVPGQAHLDLIRAKILNEDPYYGTNYVKNSVRKIIETRWIFEKKFFLKKIISYAFALLDCEGLDTIATVILNGKTIGASDNQFRRFIFDATSALQAGTNTIQIQFENAVKQAKDMADNYPYYVPDMFNMSAAQHGFPHRNFVRKEQCSFSWDWGPAFAPCGIWRPISLKLDKDGVLVKRWYVNTHFDHIQGLWEVKVSIEIISINERKLRIGVQFDDIKVSSSETTVSVKAREFVAQHSTRLEQSMVKRWWPRGYGDPKLYKMKASLIDEDGTSIATYNSRCGFRTCELVQEPIVKGRAGDAFKFRINGCDIFAKGANWIPGHVFDQLMTTDKKRSLLEGCVAANMNMIRIWGGGRYETDQFYELCDELGIMVWQEFMFACALYPTGQSFLDNVKHETSDQVKRLMIHPSIILWSGNNENQEFLVKGWDEVTLRNPYIFTVDYHKLYIETIMSTLCSLDTSRPYTTTSPSAGLISCSPYTERYVLSDLERGLYGDVHFYDYKHNGLHIEYYPNARFVSGNACIY
ncbi:glycoside hydrolase superfamily [Lobosporangium transversale]|uniref:beta-mannosidase n=1 Tax=Lobosporangium transversale TaxID=64571 RepID=A0A1Y2G6F4_9FUNG|nr:glycoside hydrolase superfamily [Lobosporangium transversale]ORY97116.1 glycoside hydrolase superfamily [Lobosporangium transversale]|eukprot:XP_021875649.1 glycoside hydrolase superfamily [Lobosporangium transversale]